MQMSTWSEPRNSHSIIIWRKRCDIYVETVRVTGLTSNSVKLGSREEKRVDGHTKHGVRHLGHCQWTSSGVFRCAWAVWCIHKWGAEMEALSSWFRGIYLIFEIEKIEILKFSKSFMHSFLLSKLTSCLIT